MSNWRPSTTANGLIDIDAPWFHAHQLGNGAVVTRGTAHAFLGGRWSRNVRVVGDISCTWSWDGTRLLLATDRYGFYPVFYFTTRHEILVSPSIPRLLAEGVPAQFDYAALAVFLRLGFFLGEDTPFAAIRTLPPGGMLVWQPGQLTVEGKRPAARPHSTPRSAAVDDYIDLFRTAMERRQPDDDDFLLPLTGGRDSRHILLELYRMQRLPRACITSGSYPTLRGTREDLRVARVLAEAVGVAHEAFHDPGRPLARSVAAILKQNFCSDEGAWILGLYEHLAQRSRYHFDGVGGDVLSASSFAELPMIQAYAEGRFRDIALRILQQWHREPEVLRFMDPSHRARFHRQIAIDRIVTELQRHGEASNPISSFYFWNRTRREISQASSRLLPVDADLRCPYLDPDLFNFLASLPAEFTTGKDFHTETIRRAFPKFAHIPFEQGTNASRFELYRHFGWLFTDFARLVARVGMVACPETRPVIRRLLMGILNPAQARGAMHALAAALYLLLLESIANNATGLLADFGCRLSLTQDEKCRLVGGVNEQS